MRGLADLVLGDVVEEGAPFLRRRWGRWPCRRLRLLLLQMRAALVGQFGGVLDLPVGLGG